MKRLLKWLGFLAVSIVTLAALALLLLYFGSERVLSKQHKAAQTLSVPVRADAADLAEGRRLARLAGCTHCHSEDLSGGVPRDIPNVARLVAPNLTTILPNYSNPQLVGLLRRGVKRDGTGAWFCPAQMTRHLHDRDIVRIIAWLRSMPKVAGLTEQTSLRVVGRFLVATGRMPSSADEIERREAAGEARWPPDRGAYLVMSLCTECHGQDLNGRGDPETPALDAAKRYSLEAFARLMHEGTGPADRAFEHMTPAAKARFAYLLPEEVAAMHAFLQAR